MKKIIKTRLEDLSQAHGKEENFEPSTLEQLIGETGINKYSTVDKNEYIATLNNLNKTDLHRHSIALGFVPVDSRERLIKKLVSEFEIYSNSYRRPKSQYKPITKVSDEIEKILASGR